MKSLLFLAYAAASLVFSTGAWAGAVGFSRFAVADGTNPPIEIGIWYPTDGAARPTPIGPFVQNLAVDGAVKGSRLPLVVMSHGTYADLTTHSDTAYALAAAGFVAAALTHTGDNPHDQSRIMNIMDRPRQLRTVIEFMVSHWHRGSIDGARVGAFGFSAGGFTILVAAGATPDLRLIGPHCAAHPSFFDCQLIKNHALDTDGITGPKAYPLSYDVRIRALVVAAPALGFTFTKHGLLAVAMPVQLWRANDDQVLPSPEYADAVKAALPRSPEMHLVANADHVDFMAPCTQTLAYASPAIANCASRPGFDRAAFHRDFNHQVIVFFEKTLVTNGLYR